MVNILFQNLQSGANISRGYWQFPFLFWKYFLPHSITPIERLGRYILDNQIDIALFAEADAGSLRTCGVNQIRYLAEKTGCKNYYFFPTLKVFPFSDEGNAIISRYPIKEKKSYRLEGKGAPRYLCQSVIEVNDKKKEINLFFTHLSLGYKARQKQLLQIDTILNGIKGKKILAGDFNIKNENELDAIKMKRVSFLKTYPSWSPKKCFDNIFISKDIKKYNISTAKIKMSDHLGLEFEI